MDKILSIKEFCKLPIGTKILVIGLHLNRSPILYYLGKDDVSGNYYAQTQEDFETGCYNSDRQLTQPHYDLIDFLPGVEVSFWS